MENLNVKDIIAEIYKILDWENVGFYCIIVQSSSPLNIDIENDNIFSYMYR